MVLMLPVGDDVGSVLASVAAVVGSVVGGLAVQIFAHYN